MFTFLRTEPAEYCQAWRNAIEAIAHGLPPVLPASPAAWPRVRNLCEFMRVCEGKPKNRPSARRTARKSSIWGCSPTATQGLQRISTHAEAYDWIRVFAPSSRYAEHVVVVLGKEGLLPAALLARYTNRPIQTVADVPAAIRFVERYRPLSVMVVCSGDIDDIWPLLTASLRTPIGFLWTRLAGDVEWLVLKTLAYHSFERADPDLDVFLKPGSDLTPTISQTDFGWEVEGAVNPPELATLLTKPKRLLAILSHSDGLSTMLGNGALCGRVSNAMPSVSDETALPLCYIHDYCQRLRGSVSDLKETGHLLPADAITSSVFLNFVCWGTHYPLTHPLDLSLSSLFRLSERIGAMITTVGSPPLSENEVRRLAGSLQAGKPNGQAVYELNEHGALKLNGDPSPSFVLFGDPLYSLNGPEAEQYPLNATSYTVPRLNAPTSSDVGRSHKQTPQAETKNRVSESWQHESLVAQGRAVADRGTHADGIEDASWKPLNPYANNDRILENLDFLDRYLRSLLKTESLEMMRLVAMGLACLTGVRSTFRHNRRNTASDIQCENESFPAASSPSRLVQVDESMSVILALQMTTVGSLIVHDWSHDFEVISRNVTASCWVCGRSVIVSQWKSKLGSLLLRQVDSCSHCGVVYDGPTRRIAALSFPYRRLKAGALLIVTVHPLIPVLSTWTIALECGRRDLSLAWSIEKVAGPFSVCLPVPLDFPSGLCTCSLAGLAEGVLQVLRAPVMIEASYARGVSQ